jgi:hypothetical protein
LIEADRGAIAVGPANRAPEPPGRDVDQHLVHRPPAQPVLALACSKAGKLQFLLAIRRPNPRPFDVDPATMKRHRAPGLSPPPTTPVLMARVALAAQIGGLVLQESLERFDPGQQTEGLKAALNLLEGRLHSITLLGHRTKRYHRRRFEHSLRHGRCSSPWLQHPEPTGSGEQRPTQICNIKRDIPPPDRTSGNVCHAAALISISGLM